MTPEDDRELRRAERDMERTEERMEAERDRLESDIAESRRELDELHTIEGEAAEDFEAEPGDETDR